MRNILKFGIISLAFSFGLILTNAETANAQNRREARREYRDEVRDARREYRNDVRSGRNRREARREYRDDVRDSRREYRDDVREYRRSNRNNRGLHRGWTIGRGNAWGRRDRRGSSVRRSGSGTYYYQNGRLYYRNW